MKLQELEKFIETSTTEEGILDQNKLFEKVNISTNAVRDKQKEAFSTEKATMESKFESDYLKDLGFEDKSALKSRLDDTKDYDPEALNKLNQESIRWQNTSELYKQGFTGDEFDADYVIKKANASISTSETDLSFSDALSQIKTDKEHLFGAVKAPQTSVKVKAPKTSAPGDGLSTILADTFKHYNK